MDFTTEIEINRVLVINSLYIYNAFLGKKKHDPKFYN